LTSTGLVTRSSGAADKRLPGLRALSYIALPVAALVLVLAVQLWPAAGPSVAPVSSAPAAVAPDPLTDITPGGVPGPGAGVDTSDTDTRIAFWKARL
jgi:hypothetical protein